MSDCIGMLVSFPYPIPSFSMLHAGDEASECLYVHFVSIFYFSLRVVMERPYWRIEEILAELKGLNISEVIEFGVGQLEAVDPQSAGGTTLLCFAHGNVDSSQVCPFFFPSCLSHSCASLLAFSVQASHYAGRLSGSGVGAGLVRDRTLSQPFGHYWKQRLALSQPGNYSVVVPTLNPEDQNSVINVIFQVYTKP